MSKLVINKHYRKASDINENSFSREKDYNEANPQLFREGEVIISNEDENPGLYIITAGKNDTDYTGQGARVINITSPDIVRLTSEYTKSSEESPKVVGGDTVQSAIGKIEKIFDSQTERIDAAYDMAERAVEETTEEVDRIRTELSAETTARELADSQLNSLITDNTASIAELSGATSRESLDNFVVENFEGGYYPSSREIKLMYKRGDGVTIENIMTVDVTEFATQIDFLKTAYTYTVTGESEVHGGEVFDVHHKVLRLTFIISNGSGQQTEEDVYFDITKMIGEHIVLTEEAYEALPDKDKNNGFFYYTYEEE